VEHVTGWIEMKFRIGFGYEACAVARVYAVAA
jgi:hypothetical protein